MKPCKNCIHHTACVTANPDMVKKTFECEHFEDKEKIMFALEKQIPKKVTHEATKLKDCTCPSCGNVISEKVDYCKFCGQALDRSEEE